MHHKKNGVARKGDILQNPGDYRLPKPRNANNKYVYYGYFVAGDEGDVEGLFLDNNFSRKQTSPENNRDMIYEIRDRVAECQFMDNQEEGDI